ncbi:isoleucyl-tRNA synthetase [Actinopolymorpha cephalotaxi]|uniref:Isoleucine--tRNA ligase n=1 Tax=Actinopolymorpha cephalotaxi TaxID=504797 RepID=A0A1I2W357_9ACTN|nr:isoleucine--tRNA ligase [Actinopolymorpha cephalotaxi]NYH82776.1 isoleucyl-tRNA synthetase [Actinopolymorpha cephalotaxi]SFG95845.1 isoleucyl-tRNA synthetase [Actinopolymorpha cephalotaxi]
MSYPRHRDDAKVPASPSFPDLEREVLDHWEADKTFQASVDQRPAGERGDNEFVFYDGPPFANGLPHYGHLLTGFVKDVVPRYQTMRGRRVERRFGWDCHGLPAEVEAERELGISTKREIVELGVERFNEVCRTSVLRYTSEWESYVNRQARWVDFGNDYKTLDISYMESVMWAFRSLYDKGLVYQGFRVLAYCWRCETPLSNTETRMDDVYRDRTDPASTVWFELETGERILAWTTMPWTLVPNVALVVGPDIDYAVLEHEGHRWILAEARLDAYAAEFEGATRVGTLKGSELVGRKYTPLFEFLTEAMAEVPAAFTVLAGDFVSTEDGTGVVQVAPSHGEDDFNVCTAAGIPVIVTVDDHTRFTSVAPRFEGLQVFEANRPLLRELRERGVLVRQDSYTHPYPHCWRCDTPLVYKAVDSWFVEVTRVKDRMVELNQQIDWTPAHVRDGSFGKWLANARDWSISRNRFWGSPIPVWKSDDPAYPRTDVYGSLDELERDFGVRPNDLHRPGIDQLTRPNPDDPTGCSTMRRVPEVLDCWFESGAMPFAQVHYPFENTEWFENHYPGDFIVEYLPQTRGWFYTLHVLATALFDRPAFRSAVAHGILQGDDGRKLSKSLRNYPDVRAVLDSYGADAMRWALMSSPVLRGGDAIVADTAFREAVRQSINPLWNAYYFFTLYANAENAQARRRTDSTHVLDRYVLAKLHDTVVETTAELDSYDISGACAAVRSFLDVLTNWYVRRSRDRFWSGDQDAFDTLYTVLEVLCRVAAPLLPLVTEEVWRGLTGERSVHLADWPDAADLPADDDLVASMDGVRAVCSAALALRKAKGLRVRLPLAGLTVAAPDAERLRPFVDLIRDEVNVKEVRLDGDVAAHCERVLSVVPRALGPRLGKDVQRVIRAVKGGDWSVADDGVVAGGVTLAEGEYELRLVPARPESTAALPGDVGVVELDTEVTPELTAEGVARDVIRAVQQARRDAGLDVSDRIALTVASPDEEVRKAVDTHRELVAGETLARELSVGATADGAGPAVEVGEGWTVQVSVRREA